MRVLAELQSLPARVASEFALLNARVDQLTETIQVIDSTLREVGAISVRNHLNLPSVRGSLSAVNCVPNMGTPGGYALSACLDTSASDAWNPII